MSASLRVMGELRFAFAKYRVLIIAAAVTVHAIPIWGRMVVSSMFLALCSCVEHIYNMSLMRHISQIKYIVSHDINFMQTR